MRKILTYMVALLFMVTAVNAYSTFVTLEITEMSCPACSGTEGGMGLEGIMGAQGRDVWISTNVECSSGNQGNYTYDSNFIMEGDIYTTAPVELTEQGQYYFCLNLKEFSGFAQYTYAYNLATCSVMQGNPSSYGFKLLPLDPMDKIHC